MKEDLTSETGGNQSLSQSRVITFGLGASTGAGAGSSVGDAFGAPARGLSSVGMGTTSGVSAGP